MTMLNDHAARVRALTDLESTLLVEAGAGSGKTALLAGRIVSLLANGVHPGSIVAVTFTEMAAAELLERIDYLAEEILADRVPADLEAAFGDGLPADRKESLRKGKADIEEMACTTIHGFCQRLVKPYPVEASVDPGARVLDAAAADLMFKDTFDLWIRERLSGEDETKDMITLLATTDTESGLATIRQMAHTMRSMPGLMPQAAVLDDARRQAYIDAVKAFRDWRDALGFEAEGNAEIMDAFQAAADTLSALDYGRPHIAAAQATAIHLPSLIAKKEGGFKQYRMKGKWQAADKARGVQANLEATEHYDRCVLAFQDAAENATAAGLRMLAEEVKPLLDRYQQEKRAAAALDFEDLLESARSLLRDHPGVRKAAGERYSHILVDEYQDTDPVQTEIFMWLTTSADDASWPPKPGSLFLVGDPKQAIYRFRGADVHAYTDTRARLLDYREDSVLTVTTNFRSREGVLDYVNDVFEEPLSRPLQPGFARLDAFRGADSGKLPAVASVNVPETEYTHEARDYEAKEVAEMCARLIGSHMIESKRDGLRPCAPDDIALLAPTGTELWRYENALENLGIAVSSQAGKGMFRQQEVQDLIALTRTLADPKDTLALGALLRGPIVGLTEQELLDETARLPDPGGEGFAFIDAASDPALFENPILRDVMGMLADLRKRALLTSPHALLSEAVDALRVRQVLRLRKARSPERALANVDRYLDLSRNYPVRGLRAFADDMRAKWEEGEREIEGRPDSEEKAVSLITMHSAKGLEWSVVILVNTLTEVTKQRQIVIDRKASTFTMPFLKRLPSGYVQARLDETGEDECERQRLWYVACTRARDLLVVPRHEKPRAKAWTSLVNLKLDNLPKPGHDDYPVYEPDDRETEENGQDHRTFGVQTYRIAAAQRPVRMLQPSRKEHSPMLEESLPGDDMFMHSAIAFPYMQAGPAVQGGPERGEILHKLVEEVLNGETADGPAALVSRAVELIAQHQAWKGYEGVSLDPLELASTVQRALSLPQVKALRPRLIPEIATYAVYQGEEDERVIHGVIDAAERLEDGRMGVVVDWKSDVSPSPEAVGAYTGQVRDYLRMNGASKGLIVFMTTGQVVEVSAGR